jgi:hypothetical protein
MNYKDVELMNQSFGGLADTLLRNRELAERKSEREQDRERLSKQSEELADYRAAALGVRQQNADTSKAKSSKVFYFVSPTTKNVMSFTGTPEEAQAQLEKIQSIKPTEGLVMTDKEPDGLKDLNEIQIDDQHTLHASDADALKFYEGKIAAKAKVDAAKVKPVPGVAPKQTIRQEKNPARTLGGVINTNEPAYLSLTNTTTALPTSPLSGAPAPTASKKPTRAIAADYVKNFRSSAEAKKHLAADGYDTSGYAD